MIRVLLSALPDEFSVSPPRLITTTLRALKVKAVGAAVICPQRLRDYHKGLQGKNESVVVLSSRRQQETWNHRRSEGLTVASSSFRTTTAGNGPSPPLLFRFPFFTRRFRRALTVILPIIFRSLNQDFLPDNVEPSSFPGTRRRFLQLPDNGP